MAKEQGGELAYDTIFDVVDRMTGPLEAMGKSLEGFQSVTQKATGLLSPLNAALGLIGAGLSFDKVIDLGSAFENQTIKMAQTAKMMGRGGETFADAMGEAHNMIAQINTAAAALPGEAEDYSTALEMAGTTVQTAVGDYDKTFNLIKDITAITISNQHSAAEGAMQLNKMLNAGRGMLETQNDYSMKLIQNMRTLPGYANLTTQSFNAMALDKRVELVGKMRDTFKDMIAESSNTLDAIKGASMTIFKTFTREATQPLFDGFKDGLKFINDQLMDADGHATKLGATLTNVGRVMSENIAGTIKEIITGQINPGLLGSASGMLGAVATGGGMGPAAVVGNALSKLADDTEFLDTMFVELKTLVGTALLVFEPLTTVVDALGTGLADMVAGILPGLLDGFNMVLQPLVEFGSMLIDISKHIFEQLSPSLNALWSAIGNVFSALGSFLMPILKMLGIGLFVLWDFVDTKVVPIFKVLIDAITSVVNWIAKSLSFLGEQLNWGLAQMGVQKGGTGDATQRAEAALAKFLGAFALPENAAGKASGAPKSPGARAAAGVNQDFRFSRFEISQKFEEGFDPDRIAVAFASQLGKAGEQKMQSGFAPLFSVGV